MACGCPSRRVQPESRGASTTAEIARAGRSSAWGKGSRAMRTPEEAKRAEGSDPPRASKSTLLPGTLAIVATPIGNLGDMTQRAIDSLADAAVIACEDTRVTAKLLAAYGIRTPMLAYHEHNAAR